MEAISKILSAINSNLGALVGCITGCIALYKWVVKPIRDILAKIDELDKDTADILCSQLTREHDYFVKLGYCPDADKRRIGHIYRRYKSRKRNHLADTFEADINRLPGEPKQ